MEFLVDFSKILLSTLRDVSPIIILITCFQLFVLRQPIPHLRRVVVGVAYVIVGLALFLAGLDKALFPLGKIMATQLSDPAFIYGQDVPIDTVEWTAYGWIYLFAALIGFATTIAEPSLIAVAFKANEVGPANYGGIRRCYRHRARHLPHCHRHAALYLYHNRIPGGGHPNHVRP